MKIFPGSLLTSTLLEVVGMFLPAAEWSPVGLEETRKGEFHEQQHTG
ncbi:hypothetical protein J2Z19_000940 [Ensifer adhaerens]|uniref:Uncharacterized protein n=1 Tax=Ensifer adhaerens TaxID=106592 RepID=A0ACC5SQT3_ENSAD|nr:hypothetical protein [Ensifer adhaerens]